MEWRERLNGLYLHNDAILHQEIEPVARFDLFAIVHDGKRRLAREAQPSLAELVGETLLINAFEKTGAEGSVHLERGVDDDRRRALQFRFAPFA